MLQNEYLVAKIGFDTAENEPSKVCRLLRDTRLFLIVATLKGWSVLGGDIEAAYLNAVALANSYVSHTLKSLDIDLN